MALITVLPYQPAWPDEFLTVARPLRAALGGLALRIDHIGSTAVPGLAAKDIIDLQVSVAALTPDVEQGFNRAGYQRLEALTHDHVPPGRADAAADWAKWMFRSPSAPRRVNTHVRVLGRANQRYALLFRDYLRAHPASAQAYAQVKEALARLHPDDLDAYYDVKDPVCDIIMGGAEDWAVASGWAPGPTDC